MAASRDCLGPVVVTLLGGVVLGSEPALREPLVLSMGPLLLVAALSVARPMGPQALSASDLGTPLRSVLHPALASLLLGALLGAANGKHSRPPPTLHLPAVYALTARIDEVALPARGLQRLGVTDARLANALHPLRLPDLELLVDRRRSEGHDVHSLRPGDVVRCEALLRMRSPERTYGRGRLWGWVSDPRLLQVQLRSPSGGVVHEGRAQVARCFERHLRREDAGLARALILGDRQLLLEADRERFRETGQVHLLAVSGLHVGMVLAGLLFLIRRLGVGLHMQMLFAMACTVGFVLLAGAPPSAVRAGSAALLWMTAVLFDRRGSGLRVLMIVALFVLFTDASSARRAAFQMSFGAVLGILLLTPGLRALLVRPRPVVPGYLPVVRAPLRSMFAVGAAAWLGTAPFVAHHIGRLCPWGPLIALPAIPLTALLIGSAAACLLGIAWEPLGVAPAFVFGLGADALRYWLEAMRWMGVHAQSAGHPPPGWWMGYVLAFWLCSRSGRGSVWTGLLCMLALLAALQLPPELRVDANGTDAADAASREYDAPQSMTNLSAHHQAAGLFNSAGVSVSAGALATAATGLFLFALTAVYLRWLRAGGAVAAWVLGVASFAAFGIAGLAALLTTFLVATCLGKLPGVPRSGARSTRQVLSNGLPALLGAVLGLLVPDSAVGGVVFLGGLACLGADTCATEIGTRFGGTPRRLLGGPSIRAGESGGVTQAGLLAALGGAVITALAWMLSGGGWPPLGITVAAGFAGALIDSLLGGTLQFRGRHPETGEITEKTRVDGIRMEPVSGWRWLDNDMVNLVSGFAAAGIAAGLCEIFT